MGIACAVLALLNVVVFFSHDAALPLPLPNRNMEEDNSVVHDLENNAIKLTTMSHVETKEVPFEEQQSVRNVPAPVKPYFIL